jgi:hypothetical protein
MPAATYFVQECPTCGRTLEVRVEYLGKRVACQHCQGSFTARDAATQPEFSPQISLLERADALLSRGPLRSAGDMHPRWPLNSPLSAAG